MNRVIIGLVVLVIFILSIIYVARSFSKINLSGYLNRATPRASALIFPTPTPVVSPLSSPFISATPTTLLPKSGVLPATGL